MEKLLEMFWSAPSNEHQEEYRKAESGMLTHNANLTSDQFDMRKALVDWIDEQLPHEISFSSSGFTLTCQYSETQDDLFWEQADQVIELIENFKDFQYDDC